MRRLSSTRGKSADVPPGETDRRPAAIAGMGYRLAAAGPRTRQRLIEREMAAPVPQAKLAAEPRVDQALAAPAELPALASWDDALWEQRLDADARLGMARLSEPRSRFPVWRAVALLTSAACGFSLVLFGQSLHLDRKLRQSNHPVRPAVVAEARPAPSQPADISSRQALQPGHAAVAAQAQPQPVPAQDATAAPPTSRPDPLVNETPEFTEIPALALAQAEQAAPALNPAVPRMFVQPASAAQPQQWARQAAMPSQRQLLRPAQPALARQKLNLMSPRLVLAMSARLADAKAADTKPHAAVHPAAIHHDLPRWLTEDRPEHERELIMSPPPHNLDAPPGAELAANTPAAAPKSNLPPIPQPGRRPALIYAEAQSAPPPGAGWAAPHPVYNANPYYAPYSQTYGYYGAMPPPTPYYQP